MAERALSIPIGDVSTARLGWQKLVIGSAFRGSGSQAGLSHMDVGELGQDANEEAIVPTGPFQFASH